MKNNDCLFTDIQNLCNAVSDWLIQKVNNPIETNETISCACCHIVCDNRLPYNAQRTPFREKESFSRKGLTLKCKKDFFFHEKDFYLSKGVSILYWNAS